VARYVGCFNLAPNAPSVQNLGQMIIHTKDDSKPTEATPPALPSGSITSTFYIRRGTKSLGAFSASAIKSLLTDGILSLEDEVRAEGSTEWVSLARLIAPK
jgi:hypothetical protein